MKTISSLLLDLISPTTGSLRSSLQLAQPSCCPFLELLAAVLLASTIMPAMHATPSSQNVQLSSAFLFLQLPSYLGPSHPEVKFWSTDDPGCYKGTSPAYLNLTTRVLYTFKKEMKREEEVTPVVLPHVLLSTLGSRRHIVQNSC